MRPNKIIGIGDIHIFNAKRFDEHKHVFNNFYKILDREKPELVVIAGDVIDSKLRLSPEQINLCREFLFEVANRCSVLMIPGNHDTNLANKERLDSLTPIVTSLWNETTYPIHYIKNSGVYRIEGLTWAVWSCMDDQKSPFDGTDKVYPWEYVFGLYHGVISGAKTSEGYKLPGGIDISEFKYCNQVIAADIHQQQSFRLGEINYTGPLLQVSVNEDPDGTCLVYNLNGLQYDLPQVVRIPNDYSTINYTLGDALPTSALPTQKVRIKYDSHDLSRVKASEAAKAIKATLRVRTVDIVPVAKKKDPFLIKLDAKSDITSNQLSDYFKEYVKKGAEKLGIKNNLDENLDRLSKYDQEFSQGEAREFENGDYQVYKVVLDNFLSFGPGKNVIDLDKEGLVGIHGNNRVGKSSIIKAIQFGLFNEMPSNSSAIKMINKENRDMPASVELYLTKAGRVYRIVRTITPKKKGNGVDFDLTFHEVDVLESELNNLTKESRPYTETEIRKYLGLNETFEMLSLFSAQKRQVEFIDCKNAERLKLVNKFLGLHNFELKEENVKDAIKEKTAEYNALAKQIDKDTNIAHLEAELKRSLTLLKIQKNEEASIKQELSELEEIYGDVIYTYQSNLKMANRLIDEPTSLISSIEQYETDIQNIRKVQDANIEKAEQCEADAYLLSEQFSDLYGVDAADYKPNFDLINEDRKKGAVLEHEIKQLEKQLTMDTCGGCGRDFTDADKDKVRVLLGQKRHELKQTNAVMEAEEERYQKAKRMIKEMETYLDEADDYREKENMKLENQVKDKQLRIKNAQAEIAEYDKVQDAKMIVDLLKERIEEYNLEKHELNQYLAAAQNQISETRDAAQLGRKIAEYRSKIAQLDELEAELGLLKVYRKIVNKDGLPLYILRSKIDEINEKVNLIVSQVFPFNVDFSVDDDKGELKIQFSYENDADKNDVGLASGSETFIINLCIKVALAQISTLPKIDTVFIDEGYDSLDKDTIERIPALFNVLTNYYKNVITISHLDEVKDMCMHQIKLARHGKYTEIL